MAYTIVYLAFSLTMLYAGYKYQKDSEFVFSIFGGKSVVSILEILLSIMFCFQQYLKLQAIVIFHILFLKSIVYLWGLF